MANEYEQYSLIQQIQKGGVNISGQLLDAYRAGKDYAGKEEADAQKAELTKLAIKQGVAKLKGQQVANDRAALELEQYKKQVPVMDEQTAVKLNEVAWQIKTQPEQLQLAALKLHNELDAAPAEHRAAMLQTFSTVVQGLAALPADEYKAALKKPENAKLVSEFHLTGDSQVDAPIIRAMAYAGHPEIQAGLEKNAADNAAKLKGIEMTVAGRQQVAAIRANASIQTHAMSLANTKATLPTPAEVRVASYALAGDPDLANVGKKDIPKVATLYASLIKSYAQASRQAGQNITTVQAQDLALSRLKAAIELSNPADPSFLGQVKQKLGITTATIPSVVDLVKNESQGGTEVKTQHFDVNGKGYDIPLNMVDAFKKDHGIK